MFYLPDPLALKCYQVVAHPLESLPCGQVVVRLAVPDQDEMGECKHGLD